jgi:hypothetical protein
MLGVVFSCLAAPEQSSVPPGPRLLLGFVDAAVLELATAAARTGVVPADVVEVRPGLPLQSLQ